MKALPAMPLTSCDGKAKFRTYGAADRVAKGQRREHDSHVAPYHCTACKWFHIGTNREHGKRDRRRVE